MATNRTTDEKQVSITTVSGQMNHHSTSAMYLIRPRERDISRFSEFHVQVNDGDAARVPKLVSTVTQYYCMEPSAVMGQKRQYIAGNLQKATELFLQKPPPDSVSMSTYQCIVQARPVQTSVSFATPPPPRFCIATGG